MRSSGWSGPILTDSGGFQVFSLRDTIAALDDDGVTFRSVYDGADGAVHARGDGRDPAAARIRHRHVPRRLPSRRARREPSSNERSRRRRAGPSGRPTPRERPASSASASRRAAPTTSSAGARSRRSPRSASTGSLSAVSRSASRGDEMFDCVGWAAPLLPVDRPRYFMGIGDPRGIIEVVARGIDLFDCVLPTRTARTGSALTWEGRLNLRNAAHRSRPAPARRGVRLPGVRALLPRIPPPPRHAGGDPRIAAAQPA